MQTTHKYFLPLAGAALLLALFGTGLVEAAGTAIGLAVANGSFQVDRAKVWGTSSLFEGSTVETSASISQIQVTGGADVRLAADSRVKVYRSRMVLEQGFTEIRAANNFTVEARSLTIAPKTHDATTRVKLLGARKVTVAALGGPVEVRNSSGLLVARVASGGSLDFEPQAAGAQAGTASGSQAGAGAGTAAGSTAADGGSVAGATAGGTSGAAAGAGAAAGGIGAGTIAIIGGVAIGATVGGLAATGSLPGQSQSTPSASQ